LEGRCQQSEDQDGQDISDALAAARHHAVSSIDPSARHVGRRPTCRAVSGRNKTHAFRPFGQLVQAGLFRATQGGGEVARPIWSMTACGSVAGR
jgi:hypothetical protein